MLSMKIHEKSVLFRVASEKISAETALFRDFKEIYSAESELKKRWSALIVPESEVISAEILWSLNPPGMFGRGYLASSTVPN